MALINPYAVPLPRSVLAGPVPQPNAIQERASELRRLAEKSPGGGVGQVADRLERVAQQADFAAFGRSARLLPSDEDALFARATSLNASPSAPDPSAPNPPVPGPSSQSPARSSGLFGAAILGPFNVEA